MHADFLEVEEMVEKPDIPVRGSARTDMTENLAVLAGEIFCAKSGDGPGAHVGDSSCVDDGLRHAGVRVEQVEDRKLRGQIDLIVVDEVTDNFDA